MKNIIWTLLLLANFITVTAQDNLTFVSANEAYNQGAYKKAADLYESILSSGNHSANLYFNLANAYYKLEKIGPSIYNYEKALQLDPENKDFLINYNYAKQARIDNFDAVPKGFLQKTYENLVSKNVDFWAWISVVAVILFTIAFILFLYSYEPQRRKLWFAIWSVALLIAISTTVLAFASAQFQNKQLFGIIYSVETTLQSEPNARGEAILTLHEGTKIKVESALKEWYKVKLENGQIGWIPKKVIKTL